MCVLRRVVFEYPSNVFVYMNISHIAYWIIYILQLVRELLFYEMKTTHTVASFSVFTSDRKVWFSMISAVVVIIAIAFPSPSPIL